MNEYDKSINPSLLLMVDEHLQEVKAKILEKARDLSRVENDTDTISPSQLLEAINCYAPGKCLDEIILVEKGFAQRFFEWFPPLTVACCFLTIFFGWFGVYALSSGTGIQNGNNFIDIAKIFAGAIVGSTSSVFINNYSQRRIRQRRPN